ncbi:hypothetical protein JOC76_006144 [Neobacillus cucumis]|nr:hypothetical protein [Neobacillus cucumis]MBM7656554.1 hypothetical protein [Neobacillus cucumis]
MVVEEEKAANNSYGLSQKEPLTYQSICNLSYRIHGTSILMKPLI